MDVASGVFAVISLSLQLAETVKKVDNFLRDVQNAPDELKRLVDTLDQLNLILVQVKTYVKQQSRTDGLPGCTDVIERILHSCESNVRKLDSYVNVFQTLFNGKGQRRKIWASIKTVIKKEEIVQMRGLIDQDISSLQTTMLINISHLQLHQLQTFTYSQPQKGQHSQLKDITADTESLEINRSSAVNPRNRHIRTKETEVWAYQGWFGYVTARSKTKSLRSEQGHEAEVSQERSIVIASNFIRKTFEIRYCGNFGLLPKSLSCFPVLPRRSNVFRWCSLGDVDSLKEALTRREVSPFVMDEDGQTLLHHAADHLDLCRLLIQLGIDADHIDIFGMKAMHRLYEYKSHLDTLRLLTTEDFTLDDLSQSLWLWDFEPQSPEALDFLLSAYPFPDELRQQGALDTSPLIAALKWFGAGDKEFEGLIRKLLRQGFDVHPLWRPSTSETESPLDALFYWHDNPFDQSDEAQAWLSILKEEGYDVDAYLDKEVEFRSGQDHLFFPYSDYDLGEGVTRRLIIRNGQHPNVWWDWSIDPSSGASLVRNEFQYMNLDHYDRFGEIEWVECLRRRRYLAQYDWECVWPYIYPIWSDFYKPFEDLNDRSWIEWRRQADLAERRFSHRMKKKKRS